MKSSIDCRGQDADLVRCARADFIVNAVRQNLPPSSLWHEKRFKKGQLESLVLAGTGGLYSIDTFDITKWGICTTGSGLILDDLCVRILHVPGTPEILRCTDITNIATAADAEFETILKSDRESAVSCLKRLTCTMEFSCNSLNTQDVACELFSLVADAIGYPMIFVPYNVSEIWLADVGELKESGTFSRSAADFAFSSSLRAESVSLSLRQDLVVSSPGGVRSPGIHAKLHGVPEILDLHFVGRSF